MVTRACPHTPIVRQGRHPCPSQGWPWGAPGCTLTHRSPGPAGRPLLPCELLAGSHQPPPGPEHLQIAGPGGTSRYNVSFSRPRPGPGRRGKSRTGKDKPTRRMRSREVGLSAGLTRATRHNTQHTGNPPTRAQSRMRAHAHTAWHRAGPVNMQATGPCPYRGGLRRRRAGCSLSAGG